MTENVEKRREFMFDFSFDKRTMYIIAAIMLGFVVIQYMSNPNQLLGLLLSAPGVLIAITFHEFAHGYAAYKLGDKNKKKIYFDLINKNS